MSGLKGLAKGGWHPKGKEGGKESWRGDFKGVNTVAGWMGKGKDSHAEEAREHHSAPLSTLKDPASFGPPPKHVNYHGAAAASSNSSSPASGGLGSALTHEESTAKQRLQAAREVRAREEEADKPPPGRYQVNTTGLGTANLPKPPVRRLDQSATPPATESTRPPPTLPPRLPPRQNSHPNEFAEAPPPPYSASTQQDASTQGMLNQGAMDRLGRAGVSIPGLNIGRTASPPVPPRHSPSPAQTPTSPSAARGPQLSELQSRFAKMSKPSSEETAPSMGTSWADKQAALRTASDLHNDPSKVSVSDIRGAASTANNFRERHGDQVASGWQRANSLNQKYGVTDRINSQAAPAPPTSPVPQSPTRSGVGKKPPPPPPKKKILAVNNTEEPPPVPLSSKPKF